MKRTIKNDLEGLIESVNLLFNSPNIMSTLELSNNVDVLKEAIPSLIKKEPLMFLEFYCDCLENVDKRFPNIKEELAVTLSLMKFVKEIDLNLVD